MIIYEDAVHNTVINSNTREVFLQLTPPCLRFASPRPLMNIDNPPCCA